MKLDELFGDGARGRTMNTGLYIKEEEPRRTIHTR